MMGADISSIGTYNHWSPLADYTSSELAKLSDELPFPTGKKLNVEVTNQYDYTETLLAELADPEDKLTKEDKLKAYTKLLNFAKQHNNTIYVNFSQVNNKLVNQIIKDLNRHNTHKLTAEESRNVIQRLIMKTSLDERNMKSSYSPIDDAMDLFKRVLKKLDDPTSLSRNLDDGMLTIARVQFNNSVGKDDVGIMANGLKAFFALTQYFNTFRKDPNFIKSNKVFLKSISINGKNINFASISDIQFEQEAIKALIAGLDQEGAVTPELKIRFANDDAGLLISSLISLATDNAKELALAKMNASIDLACMHLYLAALGCTASEIVEFATTPEFKELAKKVRKNILSKNNVSAESVINDWSRNGIHQDPAATISIPYSFNLKYNNINAKSVLEAISDGEKTAITFLEGDNLYDQLKDVNEGDWIYITSKQKDEITIGKYVKVTKISKLDKNTNFKLKDWIIKEGLNEQYYKDKIKSSKKPAYQIEFTTETSPYADSNMSTIFTVWNGAQEMTKLARLASVNQGVKVDILESTKFIDNFQNLLSEAWHKNELTAIDLKDTNQQLYQQVNSADLIDFETGGLKPINSLRYFKDSNYRQLVVQLYEYVKETFNIFDVLNTLPHFYKMLEAFVISQSTLKELSSRSRTVLGDTAKAYAQHTISTMVESSYYDEYLDKKIITHKKAFNRIPFSEKIYNKANRYYDDVIVSEWLKENGQNYEIDYSNTDDQTIKVIPNTNKGVIDFCNFIAYTLLPELQNTYPQNGFLQHIMPNFKQIKNSKTGLWLPSYKFDFDIDSLLTVQDENKAFYVQKGFADLANVTMEDLDLDITKGQNIPVTELIYLYNKLVSFAGYGQNTLDAAFDGYLQQKFTKGEPTIAQSFSQLILEHDLKQREDIKIDPIKFLAFCYSNEIRRFQKGIMHYDYNRAEKTDEQYDISDIYLFGLEDNLSELPSTEQNNSWQNTEDVEIVDVTPNNSNIDYNLLARNLSQIIVEKDDDTYTLRSTNTTEPIEFTFNSQKEINSFIDVIKEAYNRDSDGLKLFLQQINDNVEKPQKLASYQSVQVYKVFANWMQEKFNIPVELISDNKSVNGKVENGTIYLNINSDITTTPIHELMHIVFEFMKQQNFETFERVINNLTSSEEARQIMESLLQDPEYSNLMNLDLLSEVSCRILENMEKGKTRTALPVEISETIMQNIAEMLGLSTDNRNLDLLSFLKDTLSNLPAYNSLLLAPLKGDHSQTYRDRVDKITEGIKKTNIIKRAIELKKLIKTEC